MITRDKLIKYLWWLIIAQWVLIVALWAQLIAARTHA